MLRFCLVESVASPLPPLDRPGRRRHDRSAARGCHVSSPRDAESECDSAGDHGEKETRELQPTHLFRAAFFDFACRAAFRTARSAR